MFPFPQTPYGGTGGMTANQVPQPMQSGMQQPMQGGMQQPMAQQSPALQPLAPRQTGGGMLPAQQQYLAPQSGTPAQQQQSIDPRQLAALRLLLQHQQLGNKAQTLQGNAQPNNLRALLGI
jgi:hypothetical protein